MEKNTLVKAGVAIATTAILLVGCSRSPLAKTDVYRRGVNGALATVDPSLNTDYIGYQTLIETMDGLYRYQGQTIKPAIATEVAKPTDNGKVYIFKLRDAEWENGDKVTAKDFVFGWQRTVDPKTKSQYAFLYSGIKNADAITSGKATPKTLGVEAVDDKTLKVTLEHPIPYFDSLLTNPVFYPQNEKFVTRAGKKFGMDAKNFLSNGPYKLTSFKPDLDMWTEKKNTKYWNAKEVHIKEITTHPMRDVATAYNLFKANKIDDVTITGKYASDARKSSAYRTLKEPRTLYLELNYQKVPALRNLKIRQAIATAINRREFIKNILNDASIPTTGVVPAGLASNPSSKEDFFKEAAGLSKDVIDYDDSKAKTLWSEGLKELGLKELTLGLLGDDTDAAKDTQQYLQNALAQKLPGLKINLTTVPLKARLERSKQGEFEMVLGGWGADFPDPITFLELFTTGNAYNHGKWSNKDYDKLIQDSKTTHATDPEKRWQDLLQAQALLTKEVGVVPIYQRVATRLIRTNVTGLKENPSGFYDFIGAKFK